MSLVKRFYINKADCSVYDSRWAMGKAAAELTASIIVKLQQEQDEVNLLMSVGQSQHTMLDALFGYAAIDWRKVNIFHVDEKLTLAGDNPLSGQQRLLKFMKRVPFKAGYFFNALAEDQDAECARYAKLLDEHPIDIVFIGIGDDGHLAFCEPGWAKFDDPRAVAIAPLNELTLLQNLRAGSYARIEDVPKEGYTVTLPTLMKAKYKISCSPFKEKANACYHVLFDPISENYPASILRTTENAHLFFDPYSAQYFPDIDWNLVRE